MKQIALVFITSFGPNDLAKTIFEEEVRDLFASDRVTTNFFHADSLDRALIAQLEQHEQEGTPSKVILHHSCKIRRIVDVTKLLAPTIQKHQMYYRKNENEQLQASMEKFKCFSVLLKELKTTAAVAA